MQDVKTILAAVDFSLYSPQVLRLAANLARALLADLVVVNVLNRRDVDAMEMVQRTFPGLTVSKFVENATAERLRLIERLLREEGVEPLHVKKRVDVGVPFKEILKADPLRPRRYRRTKAHGLDLDADETAEFMLLRRGVRRPKARGEPNEPYTKCQ